MSDQQVSNFLDKASSVTGVATKMDGPLVPFQTSLRLTRDQEKKMLDHAFLRLKALESESGRDLSLQPSWWATLQPAPNLAAAAQGFVQNTTFLGKRSRFDAEFQNDVSWRPFTMGVDNIFMSSNFSVPLSRRICRQMIAKAKGNFLGVDNNWFSVDPTPGTANLFDDGVAERIERFSHFKLRESNSKDSYGRAIKQALILGECAVKTSYVVRDQIFNTEATVLHDVQGVQVKDQQGNSITQDDQWQDVPDNVGGTQKVLRRDKTTTMPDAPIWQKAELNRRQVLFEGARNEVIFFKDFLCPLTAEDVQTADICAHLYDKNVFEFVDLVVKGGMIDASDESRIAAAQKMVTLVQKLSDNDSQPKAAISQAVRPGENYEQSPASNDGAGPVAEFVEFYMWYDANEDGIAENIMLIADRKNQAPIYYNHVANVTTDGKRPIEIVRVNPVEGRWYGMGIMELFESYQTIVDLLVNRWNFSQSRSGRVDFWNPGNTVEGDRDPNLKMNWGGAYQKKPGQKAEDCLETVYLNDTKFTEIQTMIQFFMQLAMNESGVTNANDDQAAGMQSAKLATGILEVLKSGAELFEPLIADLRGPLERLLNREIDVTLANLNPVEAFDYLDGDTYKIDELTPDDVRGLKYKCAITLTTHKNQQMLAQSAQAAALVEKFYMLSPAVQAKVAPFYRNQLRALDPATNADTTILPDQPKPPAPPATDDIKPSMAVAIKWPELPVEVQLQLLSKLGAGVTINGLTDAANATAAEAATKKSGSGPAKKQKTNGSTEKLGGTARQGSKAVAPAQLIQKHAQPKGITADR